MVNVPIASDLPTALGHLRKQVTELSGIQKELQEQMDIHAGLIVELQKQMNVSEEDLMTATPI